MAIERPQNQSKKENGEAFFTRHSKSTYGTYGEMVSSENPTQKFNPDNQKTPDLTEAGIELARQEAEKFFDNLDAEQDVLFFASSNEARAIETADIYRKVAKKRGFEVIKPKKSRSALSDEIAEGEVRVVKTLSIYPNGETNVVIDNVFNPPHQRGAINWDSIDPELKERFERASAIIEADDRGSFGSNFAAHSEKIKEIFPEIRTAREMFENNFQNITRLIKFGSKKAKESGLEKRVKILGFGHENYLIHALDKYFEEEGIGNCETVQFKVDEDVIRARYRGKGKDV